VLGAGIVALPAVAGSEASPTVEAVNQGLYSHYWSPSQVSVMAGGVVSLRNLTTVSHGVEWVGGPAKPTCASGVPVGTTPAASGKEWSGACTFLEAGTYTFYCTVHGAEMTGMVVVNPNATVTTTTSTSSPPPTTTTTATPPPSAESLLAGPVSQALKLAKSQRGGSVRGSIDLSLTGAGGRLEIDLFAKRAALAGAKRPARARVGRLVRGPLSAARLSFSVKLDARARRALRRHRRLALTVKVTLTPVHGEPFTVTRAVVEHA
jgi:plastocyanin